MENKASILVVDDEYGVLQSFKMVLGSEHNVYLAESGEKALKIFSENSIDLILLDIMLPDVNGIDLLKKFKESDPDTDVLW